jgi:hypothetical protein
MTENLHQVGGVGGRESGVLVALEKLRADFGGVWLRPGEEPEERVKCEDCTHRMSVAALIKMPSDQFEKIRKGNRFQWMYPVAKIGNGWVTVPYQNVYCAATKLDPIPIPHRCHLFKATASAQQIHWLDDDDTAAPAAPKPRTPRAGQAGDVAARVPPGRAGGGDTEWWL